MKKSYNSRKTIVMKDENQELNITLPNREILRVTFRSNYYQISGNGEDKVEVGLIDKEGYVRSSNVIAVESGKVTLYRGASLFKND